MDIDWVKNELIKFQRNELDAVKRVENARDMLEIAKVEKHEADEALKGIQGCIAEFVWQIDFYNKNGRLP